jgi:hypothetical protein
MCSIPDQAACFASFKHEKFGTDDRIISCVREASSTCCNGISEYMGLASAFANCSCSEETLSKAIRKAIPKFAVDLIESRIAECGDIPLANSKVCNETTGGGEGAHAFSAECDDIPPPDTDFSCEQQSNWGKCTEYWMKGYCRQSCGECENDDDDNNALQ